VTDDQSFWIALATVLVPTITAGLGLVQGRQTHNIVNGLQVRRVRKARAQGVAAGRRTQRRQDKLDAAAEAVAEVAATPKAQ
jgi:hypothetical protein